METTHLTGPDLHVSEKAKSAKTAGDFSPTYDDHLRHMLGVSNHKKSQWGFRNHFCAGIASDHYQDMLVMEKLGWVTAGQKINRETSQYFHATIAGCLQVGLHKAAIKRAFER